MLRSLRGGFLFIFFIWIVSKLINILMLQKHTSYQQNKSNYNLCIAEVVARRVSVKKVFLEISQNSQKNTCASLFFIKQEALAQVFSYEFCGISRNVFSYKNPPVAASGIETINTRPLIFKKREELE